MRLALLGVSEISAVQVMQWAIVPQSNLLLPAVTKQSRAVFKRRVFCWKKAIQREAECHEVPRRQFMRLPRAGMWLRSACRDLRVAFRATTVPLAVISSLLPRCGSSSPWGSLLKKLILSLLVTGLQSHKH